MDCSKYCQKIKYFWHEVNSSERNGTIDFYLQNRNEFLKPIKYGKYMEPIRTQD